MRTGIFIVALCVCLLPQDGRAAIDCARATSNVDKLICASTDLGLAQEQMAFSYRSAMRRGVDLQQLQRTQIEWHEQVRNACNDAACLLKAFDERGAELDNY